MTTQSTPFRKDHTGNGTATNFLYNWKIDNKTQLKVIRKTIATDVETLLVVDTDYTVTNVGNDSGGNVVISPPLTSDYTITILPNFLYQQDTDFTNQNSVKPEVAEEMADKLSRQIKQIVEKLNRTVTLPESSLNTPIDYLGQMETISSNVQGSESAAGQSEVNAAAYALTAVNARDDIIDDPGFIIVAADLLGADTIGTVATNIADVTSAATNMAAIIAAPTQASNAAASALLAESWAIDDIGDRPAGSAKYWAEQSALSASGSGVGYSILGRASGTTGSRTDIVAGTDGHVLLRNGTTLEFGKPLAKNITVDDTLFTTLTGTDAQTVLDDVDDVLSELPSVTEIREIPQNSQSVAYELVLSDGGKHILHPSADTTARIYTIPANASVAFPIGTAITFINQNGAGVLTIAITADTMRLAGDGTTGSRTLAANGMATAVKVTATEWIISGTGLT